MRQWGQVLRASTVIAGVAAGAASATAPGSHFVKRAAAIDGTYEQTWTAIIDAFTDLNLPITNVDKDSGFITSDWVNIPEPDGAKVADCGEAPLVRTGPVQIKFNVRIKDADDRQTSLVVNANFRQQREFDGHYSVVQCNSTGTFESLLQEGTERRVERAQRKAAKRARNAAAEAAQPVDAASVNPPDSTGSDSK